MAKEKEKRLTAILSLKDKNFSSGVKGAGKGLNTLGKQSKHAGNQVKRFASESVSNFKSMATGVAGLVAAYAGFTVIKGFLGEATTAAQAQIDAETKLQAVMMNTKGMTDAHINSIKQYASELQNVGVIGDEVQLSGVQQLATYQLQADTLKTLMPGMNDLLAQQKGLNATQQDAVTIGNMIGKVMNGQVGALSRAGINFTKAQEKILKYGTESEKAATLAEVLKMNVGGVNAAILQTDQGKIQSMTNMWGDMKEEVGKSVLYLKAGFAGWFVKYIPQIQKMAIGAFALMKKGAQKLSPVFSRMKQGVDGIGSGFKTLWKWGISVFENIKKRAADNKPTLDGVRQVIADLGEKAKVLKGYMVSAFESAKPSIDWIKNEGFPELVDLTASLIDKTVGLYNFVNHNWSKIGPVVYGIAGALAVYKGTILGATVATTVYTAVTKGLTLAQGALNVVLNMSPLAKFALIIGGAIAAGVALYQNWDTIKVKAMELWETIKGAFGGVGEFFSEKFSGALNGIKGFLVPGVKLLNKFIDGLNKIQIKIPDWVPGFGGKEFGVNIPKIPEFAMGTSYAPQGLALMHERGGEIRQTSRGETIIPADKSERIIEKMGNGNQIIININGVNKSTREILGELVPQLKMALANM